MLHVWGSGAVLGRDAPVKAPMPVWPLASRRVVAAAAGDGHVLARATRREGRSSGAPTDAWFQWRQAKRRTPLHGRLLLDDEAAALAPEPAPGEAPEAAPAAAG